MMQIENAARISATALLTAFATTGALAAPEASLAPAVQAVAAGRFDEALGQIESAFEAGTVRPSQVYTDPGLRNLREDAGARQRWRELMERHVHESRIRIAADGEPGVPMLVRGRVVEGATGEGVAGAVVYLFQTDATGNYAPGGATGAGSNPRLFAFVRTDEEGRFEVQTIEPGSYPGAQKRSAHVHYQVEAEGFGRSSDEFHPYTHPASAEARSEALRREHPVNVVHTEGATLVCEVTIPLVVIPGRG